VLRTDREQHLGGDAVDSGLEQHPARRRDVAHGHGVAGGDIRRDRCQPGRRPEAEYPTKRLHLDPHRAMPEIEREEWPVAGIIESDDWCQRALIGGLPRESRDPCHVAFGVALCIGVGCV